MAVAVASPPEQGQLVNVRSRQWVVNDVRPSTLPPPALKPAFSGPQHLLTLSSVEDDGLGEELQVIWEIELGARVIEKVALPEPTGFDPPDQLDAFLDAEPKTALRPCYATLGQACGMERSFSFDQQGNWRERGRWDCGPPDACNSAKVW
jgi:hypothetical protein